MRTPDELVERIRRLEAEQEESAERASLLADRRAGEIRRLAELVGTQTEAARLLGVSKYAVAKAIRRTERR